MVRYLNLPAHALRGMNSFLSCLRRVKPGRLGISYPSDHHLCSGIFWKRKNMVRALNSPAHAPSRDDSWKYLFAGRHFFMKTYCFSGILFTHRPTNKQQAKKLKITVHTSQTIRDCFPLSVLSSLSETLFSKTFPGHQLFTSQVTSNTYSMV